jgi:hypothetical protein
MILKKETKKISSSKKSTKVINKTTKKKVVKPNLKSVPKKTTPKTKVMVKKITPQITIPEKKSVFDKKWLKSITVILGSLTFVLFILLMVLERNIDYSTLIMFNAIILGYFIYDPFGKKNNFLSRALLGGVVATIIIFFIVSLVLLRAFFNGAFLSLLTLVGSYVLLVTAILTFYLISKLTKTNYINFNQSAFLGSIVVILFLIFMAVVSFFNLFLF